MAYSVGMQSLPNLLGAGLHAWVDRCPLTVSSTGKPDAVFFGGPDHHEIPTDGEPALIMVMPEIDGIVTVPQGVLAVVSANMTYAQFERIIEHVSTGRSAVAF